MPHHAHRHHPPAHAASTPGAAPPAATTPTASASGGRLDPRRWWILGLLGAAQFMLIIDITVVNVALPTIGHELGLDRASLTWVVTAYTLLFGSLLVLGGRMADAFGRRRMFLAGLGLFVAASLGSGLAPSGAVLVGARAIQGIAASLLSPAALSLVTTTFDGAERNRALGVWAALGGLGAAVGVILGGVLTSSVGWQWIFFVNVPVGAVVATGVARLVRGTASAPGSAPRGLDIAGGVTFALAIASLMSAIIDAGTDGWTAPAVVIRIGVAIALLAAFVVRERATAEPLLRLALLADRRFSGGVGLMFAGSVVLGSMIFLASLYLQVSVRLSAIETGLLFVPMALALIVGSQWAALLIGHHGQRPAGIAGFIAAGLGMVFLARLPIEGDVLLVVLPGLVATAFGIGAVFVSATTTAFGQVADAEAGRASGFVNTAHEMGLSLGIALSSSIGGASLVAGPAAGGGGYGPAFLAATTVAVLGLVAARATLPTEARVSGRPIFAH